MKTDILFFTYGLSVMFYGMMTWMFWRRGSDRLSRVVALLMAVLTAQCLETVCFIGEYDNMPQAVWNIVAGADVVVIPLYTAILTELCRPGTLAARKVLLHELPFVVLILALIIFRWTVIFDVLVGYSAIYGTYYAVWTLVNIPRYHHALKERFSYEDNIDLHWLRSIMLSFFLILGAWVVCAVLPIEYAEVVYMLLSLVAWMFISYFIYRHESVLSEFYVSESVAEPETEVEAKAEADAAPRVEEESQLRTTIVRLFEVEKIYLDPKLKLSDVAKMAYTNRTYLSNYFNSDNGMTFYEFVNRYRVEHAVKLLSETTMLIKEVAQQSGFSSLSTFHRVFLAFMNCTPADFRNKNAGI